MHDYTICHLEGTGFGVVMYMKRGLGQ